LGRLFKKCSTLFSSRPNF